MNKFNSEGYHDPTAYEALSNVRKQEKKQLVYICSPYSGDVDKNVKNARRYCRFAVFNNKIPIAPHLLFPQFMDDENPKERELALLMNFVIMGKCSEVWVFGEKVSKGMGAEIDTAVKRKQPVRYFDSNLQKADDI